MTAGRPSKYSDEVNQKALDYVDGGYEDHGHPFPSVVGMAVILNIAKSTLYRWAADGNDKFQDTLSKCNDCQELTVVHKSIDGDFNPTISKLVLANFGYHDKQDSTIANPDGSNISIAYTGVASDGKRS